MRFVFLFVFPIFCFQTLFAQTAKESALQERIKEIEELEISSEAKEEWVEQLYGFLTSPLNLNSAKSEDLLILGLDDFQIFSLRHYIRETGELFSISELPLINGFNSETVERISPFVCVRKTKWKPPLRLDSIAKHSTHELRAQLRRTIEPSKGYTRTDSKGYLGSPFATQARYIFSYFDRLQFSVVADKDAGEPFFNSLQPYGFDHYAVQLTVRQIGIIEQLTLGDFRLNFAEGLAMGQGFSLSYLNTDAVMKKRTYGITPHRSASEYDFNRGAALNLRLGKTNLFLFASATPSDYSGNLLTTGLHRTEHELSAKDSTLTRMCGVHLTYDRKGLQVGATALCYDFSDSLHHQKRDYQRYYFEGKRNAVFSVNASYLYKRLLVFSEVAMSLNRATACLFGLQLNLGYKTTLSVSVRNYDRAFQNHYATALGAQSRVANEQGLNLAFAHRIGAKCSYYLGADVFRFPFATYVSSTPTMGCKLRGDLLYSPNEKTKMRLVCKYALREQDDKTAVGKLISKQSFQAQASAEHTFSDYVSLSARGGYSFSQLETRSHGWFAYAEAVFKLFRLPLWADVRYAYFDTEDYDTHFSVYERDLPLMFSTATLYDRGHRAYVFVRCKPWRNVQVFLRYGVTLYADKETISSGNDLIDASHKQDLSLQLHLKF